MRYLCFENAQASLQKALPNPPLISNPPPASHNPNSSPLVRLSSVAAVSLTHSLSPFLPLYRSLSRKPSSPIPSLRLLTTDGHYLLVTVSQRTRPPLISLTLLTHRFSRSVTERVPPSCNREPPPLSPSASPGLSRELQPTELCRQSQRQELPSLSQPQAHRHQVSFIALKIKTKQIGLGMIQQMQHICPECRGSG